jgi:serralysin
MSFLDDPILRQDDPNMVALHDILIRAYDDLYEALAISGSVGILQADIAVQPKMRYTWWSILEEAARERRLRRLVHEVLSDPTSAASHDKILGILDIPQSELTVEDKVELAPGATSQQAHLPTTGTQALLWPLGHTLKIRFLDGRAALRRKVERAALQWVDYANLKLDFGDHVDAEIRISFKQPGSWSYMGTSALEIPDGEPNVNFGWLEQGAPDSEIQRVVVHEFGHVLGLQHEHGNPASNLNWNKQAVYKAMGGPPNYWTRQEVDTHYFSIWAPGYFPLHKVFDPASIMIFPIPDEFLRGGLKVGWNLVMSDLDKQFAAALYPARAR